MTPLRARAWAVTAALACTAAGAAPAAATSLRVRPAVGTPGSLVELEARGFQRNRPVLLQIAGRSRSARTDGTGRFLTRVRIPASASGGVWIRARRASLRVAGRFTVVPQPPTEVVTEMAVRGGRRLRYAPDRQVAGTPLRLSGVGLGRRARVDLQFHGAPGVRLRASRRGRLQRAVDVPAATPNARGIRLRMAGSTVNLPFELLPDPTVGAAGDIACGADSAKAACRDLDTSNLLLGLNPSVVLALGDVQYEKGQLENFQRYYDVSWGRLKSRTRPALGNHEYGASDAACGFACGYFDYFNGVGQADGLAGPRTGGYYAFDLGAWRLYALNSNCARGAGCAIGSAQEAWLRQDLAANPRRCALAYMHHPMFTSDTRNFDDGSMQAALRPLWQAFHDAGGDVILVGHSHFYERYARQDPQGRANPGGIRQFIVGTGGRNVYGFGEIEPNSEVRAGSTFGVLELKLHARTYEWQFHPVPGSTFTDAGREACTDA